MDQAEFWFFQHYFRFWFGTVGATWGTAMSYTLIEPCCGSAALSLHTLGARRSILPYQGSKWRFRHSLAEHAALLGFHGAPSRVVLTDPGPWGKTIGVVFSPNQRPLLVDHLRQLQAEDPGDVYSRLHGGRVPSDLIAFAAEFLFLQRLAFSGKAVGTRGGCWASPGFNKTSAYGIPATDRFGEIKPMIPSLIRVLEGYEHQLATGVEIHATVDPAMPPTTAQVQTLVYLDPPYSDSTSYPDGEMSRAEVERLSLAWLEAGAAVMVSEQHALDLPGWQRCQVFKGRGDTSPFRGKQEEWVTYATPVDQLAAAK